MIQPISMGDPHRHTIIRSFFYHIQIYKHKKVNVHLNNNNNNQKTTQWLNVNLLSPDGAAVSVDDFGFDAFCRRLADFEIKFLM